MPVMRLIGTNFSKENEKEINIWYTTHHVPLILTGQAVAGERFQRISGVGDTRKGQALSERTEDYPKYLACYEFENEDTLNQYLKSQLFDFAHMDRRYFWPNKKDFDVLWAVNYKRIAKRGSDDHAEVFTMVATNPPKGGEDEFNRWYNNDHIVWVLRSPEVIRAERWQQIGNDPRYPKYLAIYRYANEKTQEARHKTWLGKIGVPERRKDYADDVWDCYWRGDFKLISKQRKDLVA